MIQYLIACHGNLSVELKSTVELLLGIRTDIECFSMAKNNSGEHAEREIEELLEKYKSRNIAILTDLLG